jgi:hypothetical protein
LIPATKITTTTTTTTTVGLGWESLCAAAWCRAMYQFLMADELGTFVKWRLTREIRITQRNPVPLLLCPPQIRHGLPWDRIRASAVRSRQLRDSTIARPTIIVIVIIVLIMFTITYLNNSCNTSHSKTMERLNMADERETEHGSCFAYEVIGSSVSPERMLKHVKDSPSLLQPS